MKLMILDDQMSTVAALVSGIDWASIGIDEVFPAYNTFEARRIMASHAIDILLCDIEMPVESGIDFLKWIHASGLDTLCIFLSSHSEFAYAQEAIHLDCFDYIVQPADYNVIREAVCKARDRLKSQREEARYMQYGLLAGELNTVLISSLLRDLMMGRVSERDWRRMEELGHLPSRESPGWLILIEVVPGNAAAGQEADSLQELFEERLTACFIQYDQRVYSVTLSPGRYVFLVIEKDTYHIGSSIVRRQVVSFHKLLVEQEGIEASCYIREMRAVAEAPTALKEMFAQCRENVLHAPGVFYESTDNNLLERPSHMDSTHQLGIWRKLMSEHYYDSVEHHVFSHIDHLIAQKQMSREILNILCIDFVDLCCNTDQQVKGHFINAISTPEGAALYDTFRTSVEGCRRFIAYVMGEIKRMSKAQQKVEDEVDRTVRYIKDNIEETFKCSELAARVYMSPNYLAKIFRQKMGVALKDYIIREKIKLAETLLQTTSLPVSVIASKVGYDNYSYFSRIYRKITGQSPTEVRKS